MIELAAYACDHEEGKKLREAFVVVDDDVGSFVGGFGREENVVGVGDRELIAIGDFKFEGRASVHSFFDLRDGHIGGLFAVVINGL